MWKPVHWQEDWQRVCTVLPLGPFIQSRSVYVILSVTHHHCFKYDPRRDCIFGLWVRQWRWWRMIICMLGFGVICVFHKFYGIFSLFKLNSSKIIIIIIIIIKCGHYNSGREVQYFRAFRNTRMCLRKFWRSPKKLVFLHLNGINVLILCTRHNITCMP